MDPRPRYTLNRRLVILLPKQPFLDWLLAGDQPFEVEDWSDAD